MDLTVHAAMNDDGVCSGKNLKQHLGRWITIERHIIIYIRVLSTNRGTVAPSRAIRSRNQAYIQLMRRIHGIIAEASTCMLQTETY